MLSIILTTLLALLIVVIVIYRLRIIDRHILFR